MKPIFKLKQKSIKIENFQMHKIKFYLTPILYLIQLESENEKELGKK